MTRALPLSTSFTEWPFSSQSMSVKSLNVEPAEKPIELPYF